MKSVLCRKTKGSVSLVPVTTHVKSSKVIEEELTWLYRGKPFNQKLKDNPEGSLLLKKYDPVETTRRAPDENQDEDIVRSLWRHREMNRNVSSGPLCTSG
jgi:hypothetical protein